MKSVAEGRIIEYPKLEETHKDHGVQLLAPHRTTPKSDICQSVVQMLLELCQLGAMTTALGCLFQGLTTFWWRTFSSYPTWPSPEDLLAVVNVGSQLGLETQAVPDSPICLCLLYLLLIKRSLDHFSPSQPFSWPKTDISSGSQAMEKKKGKDGAKYGLECSM